MHGDYVTSSPGPPVRPRELFGNNTVSVDDLYTTTLDRSGPYFEERMRKAPPTADGIRVTAVSDVFLVDN